MWLRNFDPERVKEDHFDEVVPVKTVATVPRLIERPSDSYKFEVLARDGITSTCVEISPGDQKASGGNGQLCHDAPCHAAGCHPVVSDEKRKSAPMWRRLTW